MKIKYFAETDTLAIELTNNLVAETEVISDDVIIDYDQQGKIVALTIDNYSKNVDAVDLQAFNLPVLAA